LAEFIFSKLNISCGSEGLKQKQKQKQKTPKKYY
jgi:hypothetical protein